ncbi:MAG: NAD-dependent epimerase/dehydratase family protein [Spirochaetaceae bacterium]|nr:MAG: NAD-dependent epimerase/dehydratase family protein [Spirochaetaceae bacterium]
MPSVLITGANGFIGSHLCDKFAERGYEVYGLVRKTSDLRFLKESKIKLVYGDLTDIESIPLPKTFDVIVHAAGKVSDNASMRQCRIHIYEITVNLAEWAVKNCGRLKKFVFISTALAIGYCADNISEDNPGRSADYVPYNYMKKKAEAYLIAKHNQSGFPVVILRPGDVYGPRDRTSSERMLKVAEKRFPLIAGRGDKKFGFCYPDNLCSAVVAVVERAGTTGQAYTVTNGVFPTWGEFFKALQGGIGKPQRLFVPVAIIMVPAILFELIKRVFPAFKPPLNFYRIHRITTQTTYDLSKTMKDLDYSPDNDYKAQFKAIVDWYKAEYGDIENSEKRVFMT